MDISPKYYISLAGGLIIIYIYYKNLLKKRSSPQASPSEPSDPPPIEENSESSESSKQEESPKIKELKILLKESSSDGWDTVKESEMLKVYKKITESSPIAIIKAQLLLKETCVDDAFFAIWDGNFRREWDSVARDFHVVSQTSEDADIIYFYAASPMPSLISNREFVQHRRYVKEKGMVFIVYWSADLPDRPVPDNWVRANTILSGYCISQNDDGVLVEFISQNDVKGKIPPKLINAMAPSKALEWAKKFTKACSLLKSKREKNE
jgi:hypothetical protein